MCLQKSKRPASLTFKCFRITQKRILDLKSKSLRDSNRWQQLHYWEFEFWFVCLSPSGALQHREDNIESKCTRGSIKEKQHRFWAEVYFIVESDLFPGLWRRHSLTFSFSQPIDASLITERASLTANSWLPDSHLADTNLLREPCKCYIMYGNIDSGKHNVGLIRQKLLHIVHNMNANGVKDILTSGVITFS